MRTQTFVANPATYITGRVVVAAVAVVEITIIAVGEMEVTTKTIAVVEMEVITKIVRIIVTTT